MPKKIIGIVSDFDKNEENINTCGSFYRVRENYIEAMEDSYKNEERPIIVIIPYIFNLIKEYSNLCDGILCLGGDDINPEFYNEKITSNKLKINDKRFKFEIEFLSQFLKTGRPFLGICAGMQSLNVTLGGSLYQDISLEFSNGISHLQTSDYSTYHHDINIIEDSKLFKILNKNKISINSLHKQGIKRLGQGLISSAFSSDGVIEAIEKIDHKFCIGLQWHPEYTKSEDDIKIFNSFINAINNN